MDDFFNSIHEECGVVGLSLQNDNDVAAYAYYALYALQHRGQQSAGIAVNDDGVITAHCDEGLVNDVFDESTLASLGTGRMAVGHVRYATTGDGQLSALQFLQILALSGKSASVLTADCPQYPQVLLNVVVSHDRGVKEAIMASDALKTAVADEEKFLRGEGRILVRPSGTEALIRVMVEAKTESVAQLVAERLVKVIRSV